MALIRTHRDFRLLWLAQLISQIGDKVYALALSWWVLELTVSSRTPNGDPSQLGFMLAVGALAATLFGPWLGTLADRFPRRRLMIVADLARAVLCALLAYMAYRHQGGLPALYLIVFLISLFNLLFNPATHAILGSMVTDEQMQEALSTQQITQELCTVLGAAVGGALVAAVGVTQGLVANSASFALSALCLAAISFRERPRDPEEHAAAGSGLGFLKEHPTILGLLVVFGATNLFLVPLFVLIPAVCRILLQGTPATLGLLEGSLALGSIVTTLVVMRIAFKKRWPTLAGAVILNGLVLLLMAASATAPALALCLAVIGGCLATVNVQFVCLLQQLTPEHLKGRVFAAMETIATGSFPLSYFLAGIAFSYLSIPQLFSICGSGVLLAGLLIPLVPGVRQL